MESEAPLKQQNLPEQEPGLGDSTSALKDISDHVNELESVLESLNKSCPSPLPPSKSVIRPLTSRTFLESLKQTPTTTSECSAFTTAVLENAPITFPKPGGTEFSVSKPSDCSFNKFKGNLLKNRLSNNLRTNISVRSSPNVTISAESMLNLAQHKDAMKQPTVIKPIPLLMKAPEERDRTPSPFTEPETQIDVVNPDEEMEVAGSPREQEYRPEMPSESPIQRFKVESSADNMESFVQRLPSERDTDPGEQVHTYKTEMMYRPDPQTEESNVFDAGGGIKRKAECLDSDGVSEANGVSVDIVQENERHRSCSPDIGNITREAQQGEHSSEPACEQTSDLTTIPTDSELTQQLMSVIQSTIAQTNHITCQECGLIFANEVNLHRHMIIHLESDTTSNSSNNKEQFNCPTCAFKTPRRQTLAKHITTVHSRDRSSGILYCDQCEYKTPTKSHLRNHMLAHSGNRQYQCPHCTYNSNFSNALTRHMTMHSREMFESKVNVAKSS